jgi:hypothetical protein
MGNNMISKDKGKKSLNYDDRVDCMHLILRTLYVTYGNRYGDI